LRPTSWRARSGRLLDRPAAERAAERRRIRVLAQERFSWPVVATDYRGLVRACLGSAGLGAAGPVISAR
jgi:hypothetical protein